MIIINTVSDKLFSLNGINYVKNFLSFVAGNKVLIYNAYDRTDERTDLTIYSDYLVNGVAYGSASALQSALINVIYTRDSLGGTAFGTIPYYNKITAQTGFTLVGQDLTINADWIWMLENLLYTNPADVVVNIPYCATGYTRIDYVVPNNSNGFTVISGVESNTVPIAPTIPNEGMYVTWYLVGDATISTPVETITGDLYVEKNDFTTKTVSDDLVIDLTSNQTRINLTAATELRYIAYDANVNLYEGRDIYICNKNTVDLTIKHLYGATTGRFGLPNATDLVVKPNEVVHFKISDVATKTHDYVGVIVVGGGGGVATVTGTAVDNTDPLNPIVNSTTQDLSVYSEPLSTGLNTGGVLSINADPTKFDVSAGTGIIVDHSVSPATFIEVSWSAFTAQTITNLATNFSTDIAINSSGVIVQQTSFTNEEVRSLIFLGGIDHNNKTTIDDTFSITIPTKAVMSTVRELAKAVGDINSSGNTYSANGANLSINKSSGAVFSFGRNFTNNVNAPHEIATAGVTSVSFGYVFNNGSGIGSFTADTTFINPDQYDDGSGTLATVPVNNWSIQRLLFFPNSNKTFVQYGTDVYAREIDALNAVPRASFVSLAGIKTAMIRGYLVVKKSETNLSTNATFLSADKFGNVASLTAGVADTLEGLTDTTITSIASGEVLKWNGSEWINNTLSEAGIAPALGVDDNYVTDSQLVILENTSGTNTGDQDLSGLQPKGVRVTNATTTGSYAVDWNAADVWQLTLTGATTITDTNLPTGTATKVIELVVKGAFSITLPAYWEATPASGTYDGSKWNHFVISCIVGTAASEKVIYSNEVLAT